MPPNDRVRSSGEHPPAFLPREAFDSFVGEFRAFAQDTNRNMTSIHNKLAEGNTKFALAESSTRAQLARMDDHSGKITVLMSDKVRHDFLEEQQKPKAGMVSRVKETIITAMILGALAIMYNIWMDHERGKERDHSEANIKVLMQEALGTAAPGPLPAAPALTAPGSNP